MDKKNSMMTNFTVYSNFKFDQIVTLKTTSAISTGHKFMKILQSNQNLNENICEKGNLNLH